MNLGFSHSTLNFPFIPFSQQSRNYIKVYIDNSSSPTENELQYIDNRCTIEEINHIKCLIHSNIFYRKLLVIIPSVVLLVIFITIIMMIPKLNKENRFALVILLAIFIVISVILILRKAPIINKKLFNHFNNKLMQKNIVFVLPSDKDYARINYYSNHFELWKKEVFDIVQKDIMIPVHKDPESSKNINSREDLSQYSSYKSPMNLESPDKNGCLIKSKKGKKTKKISIEQKIASNNDRNGEEKKISKRKSMIKELTFGKYRSKSELLGENVEKVLKKQKSSIEDLMS